jgi:hypothetical protein
VPPGARSVMVGYQDAPPLYEAAMTDGHSGRYGLIGRPDAGRAQHFWTVPSDGPLRALRQGSSSCVRSLSHCEPLSPLCAAVVRHSQKGPGMNGSRKTLLLMTVIAATAAMLTSGGAAAAADQSAGSTVQSATSNPDFSGIWTHLTWPAFEPPLEGPGPVMNKVSRKGVGDVYQLVGDYTNPILQPWAAEAVKRDGEISLAGKGYPTPSNQCWPNGVPYVLWNTDMQMLQQPNQITIIYSNDHEVRHVRMNEPHPARLAPSWYGDSVGHYERDALVVDTVAIKRGPFAMVDMYGTPHTEALHVVERYRLLDEGAAKEAEERGQRALSHLGQRTGSPGYRGDDKGKALQVQFTIEDKGAFTMPWSAAVTYRRLLIEWREMACAENVHRYFEDDEKVPVANKPDF